MIRHRIPYLLCMLLACMMFSAVSAEAPATQSEITTRQLVIETAGIGSDLQEQVNKAQTLLDKGEPTRALEDINGLLKKYHTLFSDKSAIYISVSSDAQFDDYLRKNLGKKVRRVAWNLQKLYYLKAFILATESPTLAMQALTELQKVAPYNSDSFCEMGYILTQQGKYSEALKSYQQALKLASLWASEKHNIPAALRGEAFCLIRLGKFNDAQISYRKSLEIEPQNAIALQGLSYIRHLLEEKK